jgi:sec-independent protein translocase protein TatC
LVLLYIVLQGLFFEITEALTEVGEKSLTELPFLKYLGEFRRAIIVCLVSTVAMAVVVYVFSDYVLQKALEPVTNQGYDLVVLGVTEALITKLKLSLFLGFLAALPIILWQVALVVLPALRGKEKRYFKAFLVLSFFLFIGGMAFAFFGVYRIGVAFLLRFAGPELIPMLTVSKYISFTIRFVVPFGLIFELPLVVYFLSKLGIVTYTGLLKARKYALLGSLVVAAVLTPTPDIFTCAVMAGPIYLLYEISVTVAKFVERGKARATRAAVLNPH